jgi:L-alanine-DL-glutamate epimerase-like enolase superfamily enzyme
MAALGVERVRLTLRTPLRTAWGVLEERELLRVRLMFSDRDWGEGEAAPLEPYDGVPLATVAAALEVYAAILDDTDPHEAPESVLAACRAERDVPEALAAIDLALWDRAGRRAGRPVAALLHERPGAAVALNATIGAEDRAGAAAAAATAVAAGFGCVKVKVGMGDDGGRLAAVRAAVGPAVAIRADANGAWRTPDEALANLRALAPIGLELCEEPVTAWRRCAPSGPARPCRWRWTRTAAEPGAAASGAADAVCLKIARCGGITGVMRAAAESRAAGALVYVASTYDGPVGIAAAVHAAAALAASGPLAHCGLATLAAFEEVEAGELEPVAGAIGVPRGPGLLSLRAPP